METSQSTIRTEHKTPLWVPKSLRIVCEAIDKTSAASSHHSPNNQFIALLESLNYIERSVVASYFCQLPWNVSSVKVLGSLNRLRILTATEFILSQTDEEHIQLMLNDFLETEFDLLANLIICGHFDLMIGSKITDYIDESIRRLFTDLGKAPKLNNLDYLSALKDSVPKELYAKFVDNHLKIILSMHRRSTEVAFASFSCWTKPSLEEYELVNNFYKKSVASNELDIVKSLLRISSDVQFKGWKNYLILLGLITKNRQTQCSMFIKKWLKDRIKVAAECGSKEIMAHVLLSIRVVLIFQEDKTETYAKWYKQHIGDMKFVLDVTEFKTMIGVLTELVPYEADEEYLEVHVKTSISPPPLCSQLCRDYKVLCRTRISDIEDCSRIMELNEDLFSDIE